MGQRPQSLVERYLGPYLVRVLRVKEFIHGSPADEKVLRLRSSILLPEVNLLNDILFSGRQEQRKSGAARCCIFS
jgi:hypothetical protein